MTAPADPYRVYAIKYAHHARSSSANFIGGDTHDVPMPLDYFVWAVVGKDRTFLVDTGFDQPGADKRGGRKISTPIDQGLAAVGISTESVKDVIITHMHYDHAGNRDMFPNARYHVQDKEMEFCTGRCMCHRPLAVHFEPEDVASMVKKVFKGNVAFHDGDDEIAPGLSVHHLGGHTAGLQVVRVWTAKGWMVLASDASHFYANIEQKRPFPAVYNVADMMEGYQRIYSLADKPELVIPGHDPMVLQRFPAETREHEGWIARLDGDMR
ncbi:N-acyl homoserine lactonase family protein [Caenimonas aquaedulcis]|uniref:N-acyl homoserine lactonase family protein n=1 Tax=Caenimonas aquaedulcis TaxID=2793270 RepID=A0A931H2G8_9BURK|nr:N-acyl homoserine lactonase family protein [Caenimonas aquaedulcis]MBG9387384.1 N-acyl homoserine lactonase family protein [Caenimonas aquaedulcis]